MTAIIQFQVHECKKLLMRIFKKNNQGFFNTKLCEFLFAIIVGFAKKSNNLGTFVGGAWLFYYYLI